MNKKSNIVLYTVYLILGCTLLGLGCAGILDEFWSGMGSALLILGVLRLIRTYRYRKDETFREKMDVEVSDERNHFLRSKAWTWAGFLFILIMSVACIVLKLVGKDLLSQASSWAMCLILVLYWSSYCILRKKY